MYLSLTGKKKVCIYICIYVTRVQVRNLDPFRQIKTKFQQNTEYQTKVHRSLIGNMVCGKSFK